MLKTKVVLSAILFALSGQVLAGGAATGGASEATQVLNHGELIASVSKQSQMVAGQIRDYTVQLNHYATALQNLKSAPVAVIASTLGPYKQTLKSLGELYTATTDVYTTTNDAYKVIQRRRAEMQALNMTPSQYMSAESLLAQTKGGIYQKQIEQDLAAFKRAEQKSTTLAGMDKQIQDVGGNVQGLQLLAQQNQVMAGELIEMNGQLRQKSLQDNITAQQQQQLAQELEARRQKDIASAKAISDATEKAMSNGTVDTETRRRQMFGGSQ